MNNAAEVTLEKLLEDALDYARVCREIKAFTGGEQDDPFRSAAEYLRSNGVTVQKQDAVPVVHGFWKSRGEKLECSVCAHRAYLGTADPGVHAEEKKVRHYCFHCGARMDLDG